MSDTDLYLPLKVEEGNLPPFPCRQHQKWRMLPSAALWNSPSGPAVHDPGYVGASHTYGCRVFSSTQVYTRTEADNFLCFLSEHLPSGFIIIKSGAYFLALWNCYMLFFFFFTFKIIVLGINSADGNSLAWQSRLESGLFFKMLKKTPNNKTPQNITFHS